MRPKIIDAFPFHDELDMLYCRLVEIGDAVDHVLIVEADITHQGNPKPSYFCDNRSRFDQWADKLVPVWATGLPSVEENPDPWARERGQREWIGEGLRRIGVADDDIVLQSDVDEIPTALAVRNVRPPGYVAFDMAFHPFAVDWVHPERWRGTVAAQAGKIQGFASMRDARFLAAPLMNAGWHFSWVGGVEYAKHKLDSFCHPEIKEYADRSIADDLFYLAGVHVDGQKLAPIDGHPLPKWVKRRECPDNWWRPR